MQSSLRRRPPASRRGVLLLVILGLLAMFGLVAVTFVVIAGHSQRAARTVQRVEQTYDPPEKALNQAILQLLRGSNNPQSAIKAHGLLEGIYGNESFPGQMAGVGAVCGQQLFEFTAPGNDPIPRTGCVLTMTSGRLAGQSTHVVAFSADGAKYHARAFDGGIPADGDYYLINGAPFSGMGFGYNPGTGALDAMNGAWPIALLPNTPLLPTYAAWNGNPPGGANGDYNAPDYQTMLLGAVTPQGIIPSLHRPDLIAYWQQKGAWGSPDLQRLAMMRPNPVDHPNFPQINPVTGPWDVPNLEPKYNAQGIPTGTPDSVWVDLGFPVRSMPDGRLYKPLFAVLCVDLDGRLNVNAHGSIWQTQQPYYTGPQSPVIVGQESPLPTQFAGPTPQALLPRGQGYGPADINLLPLFQGDPSPMDRYHTLLTGYPDRGLEGRYGEMAILKSGGTLVGPGFTNVLDPLTANKLFQYGPGRLPYQSNYWDFFTGAPTGQLDAYGAPPDISGTGAVALDLGGRPLYLDYLYRTIKNQSGMGTAFPAVDNPYEINLSQNAPRGMPYPLANLPDNPFSVAELEPILRAADPDSFTLPRRLFNLTSIDGGATSQLAKRPYAVTTDSWSVPTPSPAMPLSLRSKLPDRRARHVIDLLRAAGATAPAVWQQLLPLEMLQGCKLDLARPLGNGRDSNGNGVVNDPAEYVKDANGDAQQPVFLYPRPSGDPVAFPYSWFGSQLAGYTPQQLQARYLYVLAMLLSDLPYLDLRTGSRENTCRFLAQWAVNVVDFCDRDSIMTRFEYMTDFRNGWNPDGSHVVWGCERPELLFGESVAMHDRRTEDLDGFKNADDTDNQKTQPTDPKEKPDKDFDQKYRPQGSFFFELYNPQSPFDPPSGEFYTAPTAGAGVLLSKTTPNGNDPVWRVIVTDCQREAEEQRDPDDPTIGARPNIERSIYFVNPAGLSDTKDGTRYYPGTPRPFGIVPGGYAVVGSAEKGGGAATNPKRTYLGFETGKTTYAATTRHFTLDVAEVTAANPAVLRNNGDTTPPVNPPEVVPIDMPRRLSLSEPVKGYDDLEGAVEKESSVDPVKYKTPFDRPFDSNDPEMWKILGSDKTTVAFRMLHLQRLANPLLPYNEQTNPYRTVDSMAVDLTAFNGVESGDKKDPSAPASGPTMFESRQRGDTTALTAADPMNGFDIWKQEAVDKLLKDAGGAVGGHIFDKKLTHSFGFLSRVFGTPTPAANGPYVAGAPQAPFPWLTWNNRPFTSPLELMLVPVYSSSKLLVRTKGDTGAVLAQRKYFNFVRQGQVAGIDPYLGQDRAPFTHLLNFFQSGPPGSTGVGPGFYRILDYVHIPSHFAGTDVQINPTLAAGTPGHWFRPPFNGIPTYREPGRINLNTIMCPEVFAGLMNFYPGWETAWQQFVKSRRGDANTDPLALPAGGLPSRFGRPFRTSAGAELFPPGVGMFDHEVDATILRHVPDNEQMPLFGNVSTDPHNNTLRNPYFCYQSLSRLGNLVTTHSNVFAVWITVGYFEVSPWPQNDPVGHPDGYQLGPELGSDTGNIERHRAFYIIDRTIPVGFQRGKDYNAENAIILKRIIE